MVQTAKQSIQKLFKQLYPLLNIGFELWLASYNIAYLFDKTPFYRPWLRWMGIDLRRAGLLPTVSGIHMYRSPTKSITRLLSTNRNMHR